MIFHIERASDRCQYSEYPPIKNAVPFHYSYTMGKSTYEKDGWTIEIKDLNHLLKLESKEGCDFIISSKNRESRLPYIEIYDAYRE